MLEQLNDEPKGGEGYENYSIADAPEGWGLCCVCDTPTPRKDGYYGFRCDSDGCVPY